MSSENVALSKYLSFLLRHDPSSVGLELDREGWAVIDELLLRCQAAGRKLSRDELLEVVETSSKSRFTLSQDGMKIRAAQGHSISVDLGLPPSLPPAVLYHGSAQGSLVAILAEGLKPGARQQVHLSVDRETAKRVGQRHGKPVVLVIDAKRMARAGYVFFKAENGVWLTADVPPEFLQLSNL